MAGVLDGVRVLDLSWGIAGPITTMLLADHGADVIKIEPPHGDPFRSLSGYLVWGRGKRSAVLDLRDCDDARTFRALAASADVLVESFSPGTTQRLGISWPDLQDLNPRLIYCSITGYGPSGRDSDRPAYDALVAARTGQLWEHRGVVGGTLSLLSGGPGMMPGLQPPDQDCWVGAPRKGPLFSGVPWTSVATAYNATLVVSAALRARAWTGRGQQVHTSLLQGVLANTIGPWQRIAKHDARSLQSWVIDPRAPKGFFKASDGRWLHHWVPLPGFILATAAASQGPSSDADGYKVSAPKEADTRVGVDPEDMIILQHYNPGFADAVASLSSQEWIAAAASAGVPVQPVRSPEEALADPAFLADGCVVEVDDPELGPVRQVGSVVRFSEFPATAPLPSPAAGQHTAEVKAEAEDRHQLPVRESPAWGAAGDLANGPLSGIRVLDLGLAIAGPFGTQLLSDLGAEVIKINAQFDGYWFANHLAMCCNRGKRSIALDLKHPAGLEALRRLVAGADVVQHNMRYDAATRLGVDYDSLREIKPDLIYCHTRGFEHGTRDSLPGNDQTGAALSGTSWLDGGADNGGRPLWSPCSAGDTGNGYLSAIGIVQALYHRDRSGQGQFVDTSILYAHLLNASMAWTTADGSTHGGRPRLDAMQYGWSALYGIYPTADGWICLAALTDQHWISLCQATGQPQLADDQRFVSPARRRRHDTDLRAELHNIFTKRAASEWFEILDGSGVPCEIVARNAVNELFDSPELRDRGWVTSYQHQLVGRMDVFGMLFDLADTPGRIAGPPPVVGQHTEEILAEAGYSPEQIAGMLAARAAFDANTAPRP